MSMAFADLGDLRIAYRIRGSGPPLLLVHGAEADHRMFDGLAAELQARHTVIAYDQRDCGQTRNPPQRYGLTDLAADAAGLIEHLGLGRVHVFGTSLGGTIAQVLASRHPRWVARLVLASTWRVGRRLADFNPAVAQELARLRLDPVANAQAIAKYFFSPEYLRAHAEATERFRPGLQAEAQHARRAHMQAHPPVIDVSKVLAPTLVLAGSADRLIPPAASFELAREIRRAERMLLDGLPHVGVVEAPARVAAEVLRFLSIGN